MKIISVMNQKGGTAKTTTAAALLSFLHESGMKCLGIDLDPQGNFTDTFCPPEGTGDNRTQVQALQAIQSAAHLKKAVISRAELPDILPSDLSLSAASQELKDADALKKALSPIGRMYDYCVIDTPPELSIVSVNAIRAADYVIITARASPYSLKAIKSMVDTTKALQYRRRPVIAGILFIMYNARANIARMTVQAAEHMAEEEGTRVFKTRIRTNTKIEEAQAMSESIFKYAPSSHGALDYKAFCEELLKLIHQ